MCDGCIKQGDKFRKYENYISKYKLWRHFFLQKMLLCHDIEVFWMTIMIDKNCHNNHHKYDMMIFGLASMTHDIFLSLR